MYRRNNRLGCRVSTIKKDLRPKTADEGTAFTIDGCVASKYEPITEKKPDLITGEDDTENGYTALAKIEKAIYKDKVNEEDKDGKIVKAYKLFANKITTYRTSLLVTDALKSFTLYLRLEGKDEQHPHYVEIEFKSEAESVIRLNETMVSKTFIVDSYPDECNIRFIDVSKNEAMENYGTLQKKTAAILDINPNKGFFKGFYLTLTNIPFLCNIDWPLQGRVRITGYFIKTEPKTGN